MIIRRCEFCGLRMAAKTKEDLEERIERHKAAAGHWKARVVR